MKKQCRALSWFLSKRLAGRVGWALMAVTLFTLIAVPGCGLCTPRELEAFNHVQRCVECAEGLPGGIDLANSYETCADLSADLRDGYQALCDALAAVGAECDTYDEYLDGINEILEICDTLCP